MPLLSFVIPCYRGGDTIERVIDEIIRTVANRCEYDYEIIAVNDSSPDNEYEILKKLAVCNEKIKVIDFAKNMGKHAAVLAGYAVTKGDYIVNLDDDLQCPIQELWRLLDPLENEDYDIVSARYFEKKESLIKRVGSAFNNKMAKSLIEQPDDIRLENFSIIKRFVAEEMIKYKYAFPYISGLMLRTTHRIKNVMMEQRVRGDIKKSGYNFVRSLQLLMNGFTAFSVKPLRIASICGFMFAVLGFLFGSYIIVRKILIPEIAMGYSSIMAVILFASGLVMLMLGLIGEYIGRVYICINASPQYVIRNTINIEMNQLK